MRPKNKYEFSAAHFHRSVLRNVPVGFSLVDHTGNIVEFNPAAERDAGALADQAFSRTAGAPLVEGNHVRLLKDARENYPAWLDAIGAAKHHIHFESYIIHEDNVGHRFADALIDKAREGIRVRLIYDWMGGFGKTSRRFWNRLRAGGVEVRCYNPPRFDSPLGWLSRDHRKMLAIDGRIGFITGLCIGRMWEGIPEKGIAPWRDTGVEVLGPAITDIEAAFAQVWAMTGEPIPEHELIHRDALCRAGEVSIRVVATVPATAGMFRLDQLVAALARKRLWLTDAYYAGTTVYVQALRAAAKDGVDVRLLVPNGTDILLLKPLSRAGYRPTLGSRCARLRVERHHAPREDCGRRRALGAHRFDQSQHLQLVRQLRVGCGGRKRIIRTRDGGDVPSGFNKRDGGRFGCETEGARTGRAAPHAPGND